MISPDALAYRVAKDYGLRDSNPWSGIVPGDVVGVAKDLVPLSGSANVVLWLVSDSGRRSRFPTFVPVADLFDILDESTETTVGEYRNGLALQRAEHEARSAIRVLAVVRGEDFVRALVDEEIPTDFAGRTMDADGDVRDSSGEALGR